MKTKFILLDEDNELEEFDALDGAFDRASDLVSEGQDADCMSIYEVLREFEISSKLNLKEVD